jgi:hypothetical protein
MELLFIIQATCHEGSEININHNCILIVAQKKIPARNAMDAHVQDLLANDKLLLPILKAFIPRPLNVQCLFKHLMFSVSV